MLRLVLGALLLVCGPPAALAERRLAASGITTATGGSPTLASAPDFAAFGPEVQPADTCEEQEINIHVACGNLTLQVDELPFLVPSEASSGNIYNVSEEDIRNVSQRIDYPGPVCCQVIQQYAEDACICDLAAVATVQAVNKNPEYPGIVGPAEDQYQQLQHMALFLTVCDLPLADQASCNPSEAPAAAPPSGLPFNTAGK